MKWGWSALLPLVLALGSCSLDGGSRGSGISTAVDGNVASVDAVASSLPLVIETRSQFTRVRDFLAIEAIARARTAVEGIHVLIEGTDAQRETDANGRFSIRGNFEGAVNLVFQLPNGGGTARLAINAPAAGRLTLDDIHVNSATGAASAATQHVLFDGIVTHVDCQGQILTLVSIAQSPTDTDRYMVRLDTSSVRDAHGNRLTCSDLQTGARAMIQGVVNADGTFGDAAIQLED